MRNTRRAVLIVVVLSLLTIGISAPATARGRGEEVAFTAVGDFTTFVPGEVRAEGSKLHVRGASLAYDVTSCTLDDCPLDRSRYTIDYTVDVERKVGLIWGTWESENPEGIRGIHFGTISSFVSPQSFSFESHSIGWGLGMLLVLRAESDSAGAVVQLTGKVYG